MSPNMFKRLLFVDDEPSIRATLPVILRRYGFEVSVAATVAEARSLIKAQEFDLLLCDLNIERMGDGYEVVRAARQANPQCIVVILTGNPGMDSAIKGIREGVDDYIVKPAGADVLVALLAEKLEARKRTATASKHDAQNLNTPSTNHDESVTSREGSRPHLDGLPS